MYSLYANLTSVRKRYKIVNANRRTAIAVVAMVEKMAAHPVAISSPTMHRSVRDDTGNRGRFRNGHLSHSVLGVRVGLCLCVSVYCMCLELLRNIYLNNLEFQILSAIGLTVRLY